MTVAGVAESHVEELALEVDIFAVAGLKNPDISILSEELLADVKALPHRKRDKGSRFGGHGSLRIGGQSYRYRILFPGGRPAPQGGNLTP